MKEQEQDEENFTVLFFFRWEDFHPEAKGISRTDGAYRYIGSRPGRCRWALYCPLKLLCNTLTGGGPLPNIRYHTVVLCSTLGRYVP